MGSRKIVILHGWAYSTEKWEPFLDALEKNGFKTKLLKIPGLTDSIPGVWKLNDYVEWLHNELKSEKDIVLLGHSNGGRIALAYLLKYPKDVKELVLIDSAGIYHRELSIQLKRLLFKNLSKFKSIINSSFAKKVLYTVAHEHDYEQANEIMKKTMRNLIETDLASDLDKISIPTLIIWGADDTTTPVSDGELMHKKIKNSQLHIIYNTRHSPQFTHVKEVGSVIKEFLS